MQVKQTWRVGQIHVIVNLIIGTGWALPGVAQTLPPDGYSFQPLGLTGTGYEYSVDGGMRRETSVFRLNGSGDALGYSSRYSGTGSSRGNDVWFFDGSSTHILGLLGGDYEYTPSGGGVYRQSFVGSLNAAGAVAGHSWRYNGAGQGLGSDGWLYRNGTIQPLGLTGAGYEYTFTGTGGGTFRDSRATDLNISGQVLGTSARFAASGRRLGKDAWIRTGSNLSVIGLTGGSYDYDTGQGLYHHNVPEHFNDAGHVVGSHERIANDFAVGYNVWYYNGSTTQEIGFSGTPYQYAKSGGTYRHNVAKQLNSSGKVIGYAERFSTFGSNLGRDAWLYDGTTIEQVGLTGVGYEAAGYRFSEAQQINGAGTVAGVSHRRSSGGANLGQDAWVLNGGAPQVVGLTGAGHDAVTPSGTVRNNTVIDLNDSGMVAGHSDIHNSAGSAVGRDSWLFDGSTSRMISLTGGAYEKPYAGGGPSTIRSSTVDQLNDAGQVIGYNSRFDGSGGFIGESGWFYDLATDLTHELHFSFAPVGSTSLTRPTFLSDEGVVLGTYLFYDGTAPARNHAFWWTVDEGFYDLGQLVAAELSLQQWETLADVYRHEVPGATAVAPGGSPMFIVGTGQTLDQSGGRSAYLLTAVPEPSLITASALALATLTLRRHRCRIVLSYTYPRDTAHA